MNPLSVPLTSGKVMKFTKDTSDNDNLKVETVEPGRSPPPPTLVGVVAVANVAAVKAFFNDNY